jgi:hypothetical protein
MYNYNNDDCDNDGDYNHDDDSYDCGYNDDVDDHNIKQQIIYIYRIHFFTITLSLSGKTEHFRAICSPSALTSTSSQIIRNAYFNPTIFPIIIHIN